MMIATAASVPSTAKAATGDIGTLGFSLSGGLDCGLGNIGDRLERCRSPLASVEVAFALRIKVVVGQVVPGAEWRMIITNTRHVIVIGIRILRSNGRFIAAPRTAGERAGGKASQQNETNASAPFHVSQRTRSAKH